MLAQYSDIIGRAKTPAPEPTSMTVPPLFARKCGRTARVTSMTPNTFTSNCSPTFSRGVASNRPNSPNPALLTSASIRPNRSMPDAIARSMLSRSCTSRRVTNTLSVVTSSVSADGVRIVATTFQPLAAKCLAAVFPRPDDVPVMSAVFRIGFL